MWNAWLRRLAQRRMAAAKRGSAKHAVGLWLESLEHRDTPTAIFALGVESGQAPVVTVFDAVTKQQKFQVTAYDSSFTGGVNVAVGDVNGDGTGDLITGTGIGGAPIVKVFSGVDGTLLKTMTVGDAGSRNGVSVASADVDGDGISDLIIGTQQNNQPFLTVQKFSDGTVIQSLTPFAGVPTLNVAAGDFDGDGTPDIAIGAGAGNAPRAIILAGKTNTVLFNQFAFEQSFTGGVLVSMGDLNNDNKADLICAASFLGGPRVQVFLGGTGAVLHNFFAYDSNQRDGVFASAFDADTNGALDIVTGDGINHPIDLKAFNGQTLASVTPPSIPFVPTGVDTKAATTTVATTTPGPTAVRPLTFTVTFSEIVNGFTQEEVTVGNGTIVGFTKTSSTTFTVLVQPTGTDPVSVSVAANVATDAAGNGNAVSNTSTVVVDTVGPTATISSTTPDTTNTSPIPFTMTFSEATTGFTLDDLTVTNGTATTGSLTPVSTSVYNFTVTPGGQGAVTVTLPAGKATDTAGNANSASNTITRTFDSVGPAATVNSTAPNPTNTAPIPFTASFGEVVNGFSESDISVTNGSVVAGTLVDGGNGSFSFSVQPTNQGDVVVTIPANAATDAVGNGNTASPPVSRNFDTTPPDAPFIQGLTAATDTGTSTTDGITSNPKPTITGTGEIGATVKISIGGNLDGTAIVGASGTWTYTPTNPQSEGSHDVTATQSDPAGNSSPVSNTFTFTIDTTPPTPAITSSALQDPTPNAPVPFTVDFGEAVAGFDAADIGVTNGTITNGSFTDTGNGTFSFTVDPSADPTTITVSIPAGTSIGVTDIAGNFSAAATPVNQGFASIIG